MRLVPIVVVHLAVVAAAACLAVASEEPPVVAAPVIPDRSFNVVDYGAVPDGKTLTTAAFEKAINACEAAGGGTVDVPAGQYLVTTIALGSNLDLKLEKNATLLLSNKFDDYAVDPRRGYPNLISAVDCHDIAITGEGTINGQGDPWWAKYKKTKGKVVEEPRLPHRPYMVALSNCTRVLVQGVTLCNSPSFHLVPGGCTDVRIDGITIKAPSNSPNTDGLDPSGHNFIITNCTFDVGDDCIAVKAGGKPRVDGPCCENFYISKCTFKNGHGMSIGGQSSGGLRHLVMSDCTFDGTGAGIRLKANRGSGGLVEDCLYEHLTLRNVKVPIYITSYYPESTAPKAAKDDPAQPVNAGTPIWKNIRIRDVNSTGSPIAGRILGLMEMPVSDVQLDHVTIEADTGMDLWNVKGIRFTDSKIVVKHGPAIDAQLANDVSGIDEVSGQAN